MNLYTAVEAQKRISAAELEIERLTRKQDNAQQSAVKKNAMLKFADQDPGKMIYWLKTGTPKEINHFLTTLCEKIIIHPKTHTATVIWRD